MQWTDCPLIEQIPGKLSGAPVLRGTRVRPQDILANAAMGSEWIAEALGLPIEHVRLVLIFHRAHIDQLPLEYISLDRVAALGADQIDWSDCELIDCHIGEPVIRNTPVRPIDLIAHAAEGVDDLACSYDLPADTVRSVLAYYHTRKRQLAPAV